MRLDQPAVNTPTSHSRLWVIAGVLLSLFLLFVWRTTVYYRGIVRGDVDLPTNAFVQKLTLDQTVTSPIPTDISLADLLDADDPAIGASADRALLTIVEFADFGCPFSREASYVVRAVAEHTNLVRYVYRDFPIVELHPEAEQAAEAGACAHEQGRFFAYHDKLFQNQFDLSQERLITYAQEIGLDKTTFTECLTSRRYQAEVEADRQAGIRAGVRGTPTFFFNGVAVPGAIPEGLFSALLDRFAQIQAANGTTN